MGIPYSREINAAFEQVTPLVAAGFEVLQTTKNIAILLACIQVLTVILLLLILLAAIGLLYTVNPDLEEERQTLVTPAMQWLAGWIAAYGRMARWLLQILFVVALVAYGMFLWQGFAAGSTVPKSDDDDAQQVDDDDAKKKK